MFFWSSVGLSFDEYIILPESSLLLDGFVYYTIAIFIFMFLAEFLKFKGRRMSKWCFAKIITYAIIFGVQFICIYLFNTIIAVILIICISIISLIITNHYEMQNIYVEAQKGQRSILESHRDEEQKEFEGLDYFTKKEVIKKIPNLERMRIKPIPYFIICTVIPSVFSVVYYLIFNIITV